MDKKAARIRRATRARRKLMELGATRPVVHRTLAISMRRLLHQTVLKRWWPLLLLKSYQRTS